MTFYPQDGLREALEAFVFGGVMFQGEPGDRRSFGAYINEFLLRGFVSWLEVNGVVKYMGRPLVTMSRVEIFKAFPACLDALRHRIGLSGVDGKRNRWCLKPVSNPNTGYYNVEPAKEIFEEKERTEK